MRHLPIALCLSVLACGPAASASPEVENRVADAKAREALPSLKLEPDAKLCARGAVACDLPAGADGVVAPNGDVLVQVVGGRSALVALVRAGTDSAIVIGREGAGPGEYRAAVAFDLDEQRNVHIFDLFSRRIVRFTADGQTSGAVVAELPPAPQPTMRFVNGVLTMIASEDASANGDTMPVFFYRVPGGGPAERGAALDLRLKAFSLTAMQPARGPLEPRALFAIGRDGSLAYATGETGVIRLFAPGGAETVRGGFDVRGRATTQADIDAAVERSSRGLPAAMRDQMLQQMNTTAERLPALTQLQMMADGEIWARESMEPDADSASWVIFTSALVPRGQLRLAQDDRPLGSANGRVLLARSGDDEANTGYWWMRLR